MQQLFGGSSGSSSGQNSSQAGFSLLPPSLQQAFTQYAGDVNSATSNPAALTAAFTPQNLNAGATSSLQALSDGTYSPTASNINNAMSSVTNPYMADVINPTEQAAYGANSVMNTDASAADSLEATVKLWARTISPTKKRRQSEVWKAASLIRQCLTFSTRFCRVSRHPPVFLSAQVRRNSNSSLRNLWHLTRPCQRIASCLARSRKAAARPRRVHQAAKIRRTTAYLRNYSVGENSMIYPTQINQNRAVNQSYANPVPIPAMMNEANPIPFPGQQSGARVGTPQSQPQQGSSGSTIYDMLNNKANNVDNSVGGSLINQLYSSMGGAIPQGPNLNGTAGQGLASQALQSLAGFFTGGS